MGIQPHLTLQLKMATGAGKAWDGRWSCPDCADRYVRVLTHTYMLKISFHRVEMSPKLKPITKEAST